MKSARIPFFLLPFSLAATILTTSCVAPSTTRPSQNFLLDPLDYGYVVGHMDGNRHLLLNEFVRKGDSVHDWETLITRLYAKSGPSASQLATKTKEDLKRDCPHAKIELKKLSDSEYVVAHSHNGCGPFEGHRSVRKFIDGREGVYMIAFDMKNKAFNASEFNQWRSRIISVKLSN